MTRIAPILLLTLLLMLADSTDASAQARRSPKRTASDTVVLVVNTELDVNNLSNVRSLQKGLRRVLPATWKIDTVHFLAAAARMRADVHRVVLTGQGTPWTAYPASMFTSFRRFLDKVEVPVLGICGGHQLIALAYGVAVAPMKGTIKNNSYKGMFRQRGFTPVRLTAGAPLFAGLPAETTVWQNHVEEVKTLPAGFTQIARDDVSPLQAFMHPTRPIYGVQFHPEKWDEANPAGRTILENFLGLPPR
jgi:GMP synthase-like glutamine amidotransferase